MPQELNFSKKLRGFKEEHSEVMIISGLKALGEVTNTNERFKKLFGLSSKPLKMSQFLPTFWRQEHEEAVLRFMQGVSGCQSFEIHDQEKCHIIAKTSDVEPEKYFEVEKLAVSPYVELFSDLQFVVSMNAKTLPIISKLKMMKVGLSSPNGKKEEGEFYESEKVVNEKQKQFCVFNKECIIEYESVPWEKRTERQIKQMEKLMQLK